MVDEMEMVGLLRDVEPLSDQAFEQARDALCAGMAIEGAVEPITIGSSRRQRPRRRAWVARGGVGLGVAAAAAALAVLTASTAPPSTAPRSPASGAHPLGQVNVPLMHLADYITANAPPPTGDATLVIRTQSYPDRSSITGADLYTDAGQYFYAETESGLPAQIAGHDDQGDGMFAREVAAAVYAVNGDLGTARQDMADAPFAPGNPPPWTSSGLSQAPATQATAQAEAAAEAAQEKRTGNTANPVPVSATTTAGQVDNYIWMDSMDALSAGAGNPAVRAGVLRILSTLPEVKVSQTDAGGQPALTVTASAPALPANYQEALTINSSTGIPISFAGGVPGQTPGVTVSYQVSRVTVSDIAAGRF